VKRLIFDSYLGQMYPDGILVDCTSPIEGISALQTYPGFRAQDDVQHFVHLPQFQSYDALHQPTDETEIRICVMEHGAGGGDNRSLLMIVVGVVLIASGYGAGAGGTILGGAMSAGTATSLGVMMVMQGVVGLMMDQPKADANKDKSMYLSAGRNTTKAGTRIPLIFGRNRVFGHFLSINVTAGNKPPPTLPPVEQQADSSDSWVVNGAGDGSSTSSDSSSDGGAPPSGDAAGDGSASA
jgi:predicted phage tail protein